MGSCSAQPLQNNLRGSGPTLRGGGEAAAGEAQHAARCENSQAKGRRTHCLLSGREPLSAYLSLPVPNGTKNADRSEQKVIFYPLINNHASPTSPCVLLRREWENETRIYVLQIKLLTNYFLFPASRNLFWAIGISDMFPIVVFTIRRAYLKREMNCNRIINSSQEWIYTL